MVAITKAEKEAIISRYPNVHIVRTMKQKSKRHHYYCEESKPVMRFLNGLREGNSSSPQKVGAVFEHRKKPG